MKLFFFILMLFFHTNAYAYLDPGTGSIIIQAILGAIAAVMTTASFYWQKTKTLIAKFFSFFKRNKKELEIKNDNNIER